MNEFQKESFIKSIFSKIANRYDFVNTCVSFGSNMYWINKFTQHLLDNHSPKHVLDLCCGTATVSKSLLEEVRRRQLLVPTLDCVDFCEQMLKEAQKRLSHELAFIRYIRANAVTLPVSDNTYDTIMISYGIRNICNREKAILEISRVLKPKGKLFILELTRPNPLISPILRLYLQVCVPTIGGIFTRQWKGYRHFASSIYSFSASRLIEQLHQAGFACREIFSNSCGLLTFIHAEKL